MRRFQFGDVATELTQTVSSLFSVFTLLLFLLGWHGMEQIGLYTICNARAFSHRQVGLWTSKADGIQDCRSIESCLCVYLDCIVAVIPPGEEAGRK